MNSNEYHKLQAGKLTETQLLQYVRATCRALGLLVYHTHYSKHSEPGFPDLVILGSKLLFRELKTEVGKLTKDQRAWLDTLTDRGYDAALWRPHQWFNGHITWELQEVAK